MDLPLPDWILEMPPGLDKQRAVDRFVLQLAGIYASKKGSVKALADLIEMNYDTLKSQVSDCKKHRVPSNVFDDIYDLLGHKFELIADRERLGI